jgi:hypothetical protein
MTITLVVETGLKPTGANTYLSLADADSYHSNLGNTDWPDATGDELKKQALILATQSVDLLYGSRYMSSIYPDSNQVLLFPRMWFIDANARINLEHTIPACLKNAVAEIALMQLNEVDIFPQASITSLVKTKSVKAGDIATATEYFKGTEGESFSGFRKIDIILRPILKTAQAASWRLRA